MNFDCFSVREENTGGKCFFCETNLADYLDSISSKYKDYEIQRGFVNNVFLDRIAESVKNDKLIPPIVLVKVENEVSIEVGKSNCINRDDFNILDGLQRTMRLKMLYEATKFLKKYETEISEFSKLKLRTFFNTNSSEYFTESNYIITALDYNLSIEDFNNYKQWFEIWVDLDKNKQIEKMILLNAGHKSMDLKHQLELIFLNYLNMSKYHDEKCKEEKVSKTLKDFVCIINSKNISTRSFYSKKSKYDIHFALLLDGIIGFEKKKPFSIDQKSLVDLQENYDDYKIIQSIVSEESNIDKLIEFFKFLDDQFVNEYNEKGLEFLGRESVIIGLFAALGNLLDLQNFNNSVEDMKKLIKDNIKQYNVTSFEDMKKKIDITSFNVADIMKETVYFLTLNIIHGNKSTFENFPVYNSSEYRTLIKGFKNEFN